MEEPTIQPPGILSKGISWWRQSDYVNTIRAVLACLIVVVASGHLVLSILKVRGHLSSLETLPLAIDLVLYAVALLLRVQYAIISFVAVFCIFLVSVGVFVAMSSVPLAIMFAALIIAAAIASKSNH